MDIKRDIVEIAEELGIDLTYHDGADKPYYIAFCPLHDNTRTPSFVIYPTVQRFYCYGCTPEGGDVIDLVRAKLGYSYPKARKFATTELANEDAVVQILRETVATTDLSFLQLRATKLNDEPRRLNFQTTQGILRRFDMLIEMGNWLEADRMLRTAGV